MILQKHPRAAFIMALLTAFVIGDAVDSIHLIRFSIVKTSLLIATAVSEPEQLPKETKHAKHSKSAPVLAFGGAQ